MKPIEPLTAEDLAELLAEADDQAERDAEAAYDAAMQDSEQ